MEFNSKVSVVIKWYRVESWLYERGFVFFAKIIYHLIQVLFGCTIPYSAVLEKGVNVAHFHGIVIHQKSHIKSGTIIYQNVCLGGRNGKGGPNVGHNCIIGAGACILGEITIGDNVKIGANAVVLEDIPSNCTVVGVPAVVVKKGGD